MSPEEIKKTPRPAPVPELPVRSSNRVKTIIVLVLLVAALAVGGVLYWNYSQTYESTDDAQVDAHLNSISARIAGTVTAIHAEENQLVQAGQLLAELDPSD